MRAAAAAGAGSRRRGAGRPVARRAPQQRVKGSSKGGGSSGSRGNPYASEFPRTPQLYSRGGGAGTDIEIWERDVAIDMPGAALPRALAATLAPPMLIGHVPTKWGSHSMAALRSAIDRFLPERMVWAQPDEDDGPGRPARYAFAFADGAAVPLALEGGLNARAFLPTDRKSVV